MTKLSTEAKGWYDGHAPQYTTQSALRTEWSQQAYFLSLLNEFNTPRILDAGCGAGKEVLDFANHEVRVLGVDVSLPLLQEGNKILFQNNAFPAAQGDFHTLPFPNESFQGVWAHAALVHEDNLESTRKALREFSRILGQGGVLHLSVKIARRDGIYHLKDGRGFRYFTPSTVENLIQQSGFELIEDFGEGQTPDTLGRKNVNWKAFYARKA